MLAPRLLLSQTVCYFLIQGFRFRKALSETRKGLLFLFSGRLETGSGLAPLSSGEGLAVSVLLTFGEGLGVRVPLSFGEGLGVRSAQLALPFSNFIFWGAWREARHRAIASTPRGHASGVAAAGYPLYPSPGLGVNHSVRFGNSWSNVACSIS